MDPNKNDNKKIIYNKLVRDGIPSIILSSGATCQIRKLNQDEFIEFLSRKLVEEAQEFVEAKTKDDQIKELSDVSEIIKTLKSELKIQEAQVENMRLKRQKARGGFKDKIFLISTEGGNYKS